jgi:hypothetical protein
MASYSGMLLVNWSLAAQRSFIPEGDTKIVAAPAPALPQAPSQYTN